MKAHHIRSQMKQSIRALGLNDKVFDVHSLRIGRSSDLIKYGYSIKEVQHMGHWKSNAVFKYIH